jgi:hypothetical protein
MSNKDISLEDLDERIRELEQVEKEFNRLKNGTNADLTKLKEKAGLLQRLASSLQSSISAYEQKLKIIGSDSGSLENLRRLKQEVNILDTKLSENLAKVGSSLYTEVESILQKKVMRPVGKSILLSKKGIFEYLKDEERARFYDKLLLLGTVKFMILKEILAGKYDAKEISKKTGVDEQIILKSMEDLRKDGYLKNGDMSEYTRKALSYYKFLTSRATSDPNCAALAIYPVIFSSTKGRPLDFIKSVTELDDNITGMGLKTLKEQEYNLLRQDNSLYFGDTDFNRSLRDDILKSYEMVDSIE